MTQPSPDAILKTGLAFWPAKTLLSAIELGLFTELASGPETFEGLRTRLGLHPRSARDFFDTLVALGFLSRHDGRYANTPETDLFLDRRKPSYIGGILEMANARLYRFWGDLTDGLKTGLPQNEIKHGMTGLFEGAVCRAGATEAVPRGDDRHEPWRQHDDRPQLPVERLPDLRRRRDGAGRSRGADRPRQPAPDRPGLRPAKRSGRSSPSTSPGWACPGG